MALLVTGVTSVIAWAFAQAPLPPGVDPGHWLAVSYSYVGLPTAPDPSDRPFFYAPLLFPILGLLVVATGSPPLAAGIVGVGLFAGYGFSLIPLARRYLASAPLQVALVGLGVGAGSTIQMLFWGGYPNLLGFILMNGALIFLLRFVRSQRDGDGAVFFGLTGLTYFAHDLTFAVLVAVIAVAGFYLLVLRRIEVRFLFRPIVLVGVLALVGVIGAYGELTSAYGIPHPSYFVANPAAWSIDEVGELFAPFGHAPVYLPAMGSVYLPPVPTAVLLASAPIVGLVALGLTRHRWPGALDTRLSVGTAWLAAALAVPGVGYLAHVDTDYTRFVYFLPLPFTLLVLLAIERAALPALLPVRRPVAPPRPGAVRRWTLTSVPGSGPAVTAGVVALVLLGVFVGVTGPAILHDEATGSDSVHGASFVAAMDWLRSHPGPGNVLTVQSAARWTEALTNRDAITVGPVWLLFDPAQITTTQEAYWALVSQYAVTNNAVALSYSGFATPVMSQAPMYTAYVEGVPFPIVRILPGSLVLNATGPNGDGACTPVNTGPPTPETGEANPAVAVTYGCALGTIAEVGTVLPDGSAQVTLTVAPVGGGTVRSLGFTLQEAPTESSTIHTDSTTAIALDGETLAWSTSGKVGQSPAPARLTTSIGFSEAPVPAAPDPLAAANSWTASFPNPNPSGGFSLVLTFVTPGASNPTAGLPPTISTQGFLDASSVQFLLWPNRSYGSVELTYYEATFGFHTAFSNADWVVLER